MANPQGMRIANCVHCGAQGMVPVTQINYYCRTCDKELRPWAYGYVRPGAKKK